MANRRMFSLSVVDTDLFLDMPLSTQALYFHLSMRADDDGFVGNAKKIKRMIGASDDDLKMLVAKKFVIPFETGICVIKHWRIHNYIQKDRYHPTFYKSEKASLQLENNMYNKMDTRCIQNDNNVYPEVRLELGKSKSKNIYSHEREIFDYWNSKNGVINHQEESFNKNKTKISTAIKKYGKNKILVAIDRLNSVVLDEKCRYNFRWNLFRFLKQSNGINNWLDDGQLWNNYKNRGGENNNYETDYEEAKNSEYGW